MTPEMEYRRYFTKMASHTHSTLRLHNKIRSSTEATADIQICNRIDGRKTTDHR